MKKPMPKFVFITMGTNIFVEETKWKLALEKSLEKQNNKKPKKQ